MDEDENIFIPEELAEDDEEDEFLEDEPGL